MRSFSLMLLLLVLVMPGQAQDNIANAEHLIQQAAQSGAPTLNLRDMGLTELPDSIGSLSQLKRLWLEGNQLKRCRTASPD